MRHSTFSLLIALGMALLLSGRLLAEPSAESAEGILLQRIAEEGLEIGFNEEGERVIQIGVVEKPYGTYDAKRFPTFRDGLYRVAEFKAKAEILRFLSMTVDISAETIALYSDGVALKETMTTIELLSHLRLNGFMTLLMAESWKHGMYQVAVAVGWSPKSEALVAASMGSSMKDSSPGENSPEWRKWAAAQDFRLMFGASSFVDSCGIIRHTGIGFADIDGLQGQSLVNAWTKARTKAVGNLCLALYGDTMARTFAQQWLKEFSIGEINSWNVGEKITDTIFQQCRSIHVIADEVFTTTIVHPVTRRKMCVSVVGIEPGRFAELNLSASLQ